MGGGDLSALAATLGFLGLSEAHEAPPRDLTLPVNTANTSLLCYQLSFVHKLTSYGTPLKLPSPSSDNNNNSRNNSNNKNKYNKQYEQ